MVGATTMMRRFGVSSLERELVGNRISLLDD